MPDRLRQAKWILVERAAAWHAWLRSRRPRSSRVFNALVRAAVGTYARLELPRSVGLMEAAVAAFPDAWPSAGVRETRALWHGLRLRLDCADYFQRLSFLLRRYPDVPTQLLLARALQPGDTLIDGGANVGLVTLLGAWRVGPRGRVHAFEPGPGPLEGLRWHIRTNQLEQVTIHPTGLSDREQSLELVLPGHDNLGSGTFAPLPERHAGQVRSRAVARTVSLDAFSPPISGALAVKLDVEGFELRALRGMLSTIERHKPLILTEVNAEMLAQAGASPQALADFLTSRGYLPFAYPTSRAIIRQRRLILRTADPAALPVDTAWIHPVSAFWDRLGPLIR